MKTLSMVLCLVVVCLTLAATAMASDSKQLWYRIPNQQFGGRSGFDLCVGLCHQEQCRTESRKASFDTKERVEYPLDSSPVWRYMAKDALRPPQVRGVDEFRKALIEAEKAANQKQKKNP